MVFYEPDKRDRGLLPHDPFKAFVAPRPIGWVSTVGPGGEVNLAPYSYFNAVCDAPPTVMFSSAGPKDSATFAHSGGEFVWNMVTWDLREQMNLTSATLPRGENEFEHAGLEMAPSTLVAPPRVANAPVAFECKVTQVVEIVGGKNIVTFGQVVGVHLDERYVVDGIVDLTRLKPIARCGYRGDYAVVDSLFEMIRPDFDS
ncbi:flavin reductase (DIM6/NTAB) family NADH-FMN oxidoreductase RutF [Solirubrobacter pauli]|uniref:Flavin reductase (DIM6/NTAB) family NADH-FMN oxidoreductase RutF n=1 Tax=Solirubrobacter pauli TaxID=166793 RepID=A0A660LJF3_9ACTN|nr:flavin reductase family protein [Solirubrobacter pauli]RKQ93404.1 flavin reductase (DIM6/NTAB) family NADH-FMN oxidoreductase RutF [Solirubrobacter pauli]